MDNKRLQDIRELIGAGEQKGVSIFSIYNNQSIIINFISHDGESEQDTKSELVGAEAS